jgi:hypothetical protein
MAYHIPESQPQKKMIKPDRIPDLKLGIEILIAPSSSK